MKTSYGVVEDMATKSPRQPIPETAAAFSILEFCAWAGVGRSSAYQQLRDGKLRAKKIGKRTVVLRADAEHWLAELPVFER
jgi:hypothetical protein